MEEKSYRPGVLTEVCPAATPLIELSALILARASASFDLNPLELIEFGAVYVNGVRTMNPNRLLKPGDEVRIHSSPRRYALPQDLHSRIIAETDDTLLVEKPADLPSEPQVDNASENLVAFLEQMRGQRFFPAHRLATESEGLMLIGKSLEAASRIQHALARGRVKRVYAAALEKPLAVQEYATPTGAIKILSCEERRTATGLLSENRTVWILESGPIDVYYRVEIEFYALRPKEVRAFLAESGVPAIGDRAHGSRHVLTDSVTKRPAIAFRAVFLALDCVGI